MAAMAPYLKLHEPQSTRKDSYRERCPPSLVVRNVVVRNGFRTVHKQLLYKCRLENVNILNNANLESLLVYLRTKIHSLYTTVIRERDLC